MSLCDRYCFSMMQSTLLNSGNFPYGKLKIKRAGLLYFNCVHAVVRASPEVLKLEYSLKLKIKHND